MSSNLPVAVAFVGAGYMGREHLRAFAAVPGVRLAGLHSRTRNRAKSLAADFQIEGVCGSVAELYERTRADLVVVSVPELAAREVAEACFQFPWTVLLEKPAGYDLADAEAIADSAATRVHSVYVALNRRFYSSTREAMAQLRGVKSPRFIQVNDQEDQAAALAAGQPELVVRNWMFANSVHVIDYLRVFGRGEVTRVEPVIAWDPERPDTVLGYVEFSSGDRGTYTGVWNAPSPWSVSVTTPEVRWEMRPLEQAGYQPRGERRLHLVETAAWDTEFKPGLRQQAEEVVRAVRGEPSTAVTLADSLKTMRLVAAIFEPRRG